MDEISKIADYYPEIIYLPSPTKTWSGFMLITCSSNPNIKERFKLRLEAPHYPELKEINITFGPQIAALRNSNFTKQLNDLLKKAKSIFTLLQQIEVLITSIYPFDLNIPLQSENFTIKEMIEQIKEVLLGSQELVLSSKKDLEELILTVKQISATLKWKSGWEVVACDLPESLDFATTARKKPLKEIISLFLECNEQMATIWKQLEEIDEMCYVIDPKTPKPYHLYRRIYLKNSLSVNISIETLDLTGPDIQFLGSETDVKNMKEKCMEKITDWDPSVTIYLNLLRILEIKQFPPAPKVNKEARSACFDDNECCICFELESDKGFQPDKACPNSNCARVFHSACLLKWLVRDGKNKVVFGDIYGICPHCEQSISCAVDV